MSFDRVRMTGFPFTHITYEDGAYSRNNCRRHHSSVIQNDATCAVTLDRMKSDDQIVRRQDANCKFRSFALLVEAPEVFAASNL